MKRKLPRGAIRARISLEFNDREIHPEQLEPGNGIRTRKIAEDHIENYPKS